MQHLQHLLKQRVLPALVKLGHLSAQLHQLLPGGALPQVHHDRLHRRLSLLLHRLLLRLHLRVHHRLRPLLLHLSLLPLLRLGVHLWVGLPRTSVCLLGPGPGELLAGVLLELLGFVALGLGVGLLLLVVDLALVEAGVVVLAVEALPEIGEDLLAELVEGVLEVKGLLVDLGFDGIVELAVVPAELDLVKDFLYELVLAFVVLPPDQVQVRWLLHDQLVVLEAQRCIPPPLPLCGTGLRKAADSSIISSPWMIFTTFLLSSRSIGVIDFYENIRDIIICKLYPLPNLITPAPPHPSTPHLLEQNSYPYLGLAGYNIQMEESENYQGVQERSKEAERYVKIKVLGEGSMGKAYLVQSSEDGLQYVMKRINIGHLEAKEKESALRESQLHSLLQHPNIVQFKELYQTTGDKLCIIMEYAEGGDLEEFISSQASKLLPEQTVLSIFSQICLGLQEVHAKKIIHRDLKTANIFLSKDKQVKIGDFGISRTLDKTQMAATSMIGTPYYLSPEMVEGKPYSTKADIWALGIILYQLCTFKLPFEANSLPVLALKILKGSFPPIPAHYSKDLKALLLQLLSTDQKKRPSVEAMLTKPLINKYLPQEEKAKLLMRQEQREEAKKEREQLKKVDKVEKVDKGEKVEEKERLKREKEEKREQLRKQMREDLKKKRGEKQYQSEKSSLTPPPEPTRELKKSPRKDISITPKIETSKVKKEEIAKPWKNKKPSEKKDITIQIFTPQLKPNIPEPLKQQQPKQTRLKSEHSAKEELGRKSMPLITQKVNNYHYVENKNAFEGQDEESDYIEEEFEEDEEDFHEMMNNVRNVEELTKNLPNPSREVCLFEDSGNFDSTTSIPKPQPRAEELQSLALVLNTESLQELRYILESNLGDQRFLEAYSTVKEHLDSYYQLLKGHEQDRDKLKKEYMFNREILREKLHFLTQEEFLRNIQLLFTLIIYEELETHHNTQGLMDMHASKYHQML